MLQATKQHQPDLYYLERDYDRDHDYTLELYIDGMGVPSMESIPGSPIQRKQSCRNTGGQLDALDAVAEAIRATRPELRPLGSIPTAITCPDSSSSRKKVMTMASLLNSPVDVDRPAEVCVEEHVDSSDERYVDGFVDGYIDCDTNRYREGSFSDKTYDEIPDTGYLGDIESDPASSKGYETVATAATEYTEPGSPLKATESSDPDIPPEAVEDGSSLEATESSDPDILLEPTPLMVAKMKKMAERSTC